VFRARGRDTLARSAAANWRAKLEQFSRYPAPCVAVGQALDHTACVSSSTSMSRHRCSLGILPQSGEGFCLSSCSSSMTGNPQGGLTPQAAEAPLRPIEIILV
jgi:hypothetical protein